MKNSILFIVDMQNDFIDGSLTVKGGNDAVDNLIKHIDELDDKEHYNAVIITNDWHTENHISFKEWPRHCVAHTDGAKIPERLMEKLMNTFGYDFVYFEYKGRSEDKDEYSIFDNECNCKEVQSLIKSYSYDGDDTDITVCGIAGDICVYNTIKDMISLGYKDRIEVLMDATASIDGGRKLNELIDTEHLRKV